MISCNNLSKRHKYLLIYNMFFKRVLDIFLSSFGILFFSPFFLCVAILIKSTSSGTIFFTQKRIGKNGKPFLLYKFRSMYTDAEEYLKNNPSIIKWDGPIIRINNDPRVTNVGKFLRLFCFDELPQLFNVFLGQMSIVGPRPHLPEEFEKYEPWHHMRLTLKPGLTCFWQISDRHNICFDEWIKMDLYYIKQLSFALDIKIIFLTFVKLFKAV